MEVGSTAAWEACLAETSRQVEAQPLGAAVAAYLAPVGAVEAVVQGMASVDTLDVEDVVEQFWWVEQVLLQRHLLLLPTCAVKWLSPQFCSVEVLEIVHMRVEDETLATFLLALDT